MEPYLSHVVMREKGKIFSAVCLRCGFQAASPDKGALKQAFQVHPCKKQHATSLAKRAAGGQKSN